MSDRGHGRFWLGLDAGRRVVMVAHRFAWALESGVDGLVATPTLGTAVTIRCASVLARGMWARPALGVTGRSG